MGERGRDWDERDSYKWMTGRNWSHVYELNHTWTCGHMWRLVIRDPDFWSFWLCFVLFCFFLQKQQLFCRENLTIVYIIFFCCRNLVTWQVDYVGFIDIVFFCLLLFSTELSFVCTPHLFSCPPHPFLPKLVLRYVYELEASTEGGTGVSEKYIIQTPAFSPTGIQPPHSVTVLGPHSISLVWTPPGKSLQYPNGWMFKILTHITWFCLIMFITHCADSCMFQLVCRTQFNKTHQYFSCFSNWYISPIIRCIYIGSFTTQICSFLHCK